jgi:putative aldouronate transport system permease protein
MTKKRNGSGFFGVFNYSFMVIICAVFLYPFIYTISVSFSSVASILQGKVFLYPIEFTTAAYKTILKDNSMITSFFFTLKLTVVGVFASLVATTLTAYPLTRKGFKGKNVILNLIIFTMYFSGGLIPTYMVIKGIGLMDKMSALVLPGMVSTFLLILMMNYFRGIPDEMEESAKLDGANHYQILFKIIIPLSMPIIATLTIYYAVSYWNTFFNALMYMQSAKHYTLQIKLYNLLVNTDILTNSTIIGANDVMPENLKGAVVIITAAPILAVYPFLQKYFIKGVTIGALKG